MSWNLKKDHSRWLGEQRYDLDLHQRDVPQGLGAGQAKGAKPQLMQRGGGI